VYVRQSEHCSISSSEATGRGGSEQNVLRSPQIPDQCVTVYLGVGRNMYKENRCTYL
jgi:hypothetical protein